MDVNNKLTKMIMGQEYDTESANMIFNEEDIDWKMMNIKMTIDKTGKQHPSWLYTPLYTKDCIIPAQLIPNGFDQITVEPHPIYMPQTPQPGTALEYETISVNEEFDVEMGYWKQNEAFRLIFDPTGKIRPFIELLNGIDVIDPGSPSPYPYTASPDPYIPSPDPYVPSPDPDTQSPDPDTPSPDPDTTSPDPDKPSPDPDTPSHVPNTVIADPGPQSTDPELLSPDPGTPSPDPGTRSPDPGTTITNPDITAPIKELPKQPDEVLGQSINQEERFQTLNLSTIFTFILPDIHQFGKDMKEFIKDELIDIRMLQILTTNGGINWWSDIKGCCKLFPLWTLRNEVSLLHAVSFVLYGFNSHIMPLQNSLLNMLLNPLINKSIKQRWSYELWIKNSRIGKQVYSLDQLEKRWQNVIRGSLFDYLNGVTGSKSRIIQSQGINIEPIHVYMLANLLCRPIIILSEVEEMRESLTKNNIEKNAITGIYLPLEQAVDDCYKFPIFLGYQNFHFSALVASENKLNTLAYVNSSACVPVTDSYLSLLPLHFITYPGAEWKPVEVDDPKQIPEITVDNKIAQLVKYLHLVQVRFSKQSYDWQTKHENKVHSSSDNNENKNILIAAKTSLNKTPSDYREMVTDYANGAKKRHNKMKRKKVNCRGNGCSKIPSSQLGGVCVQCYHRALLNHPENK